MFLNEGEAIWLTAQEAAERTQTIRIAGILLFVIVVFGCMWLIIMWKHKRDEKKTEAERELVEAEKEKIEAENAKERIKVAESIDKALIDALKQDSGWKAQYFILKAKYDALEEHAKSMEWILETAKGANGFKPQEA